MPHTVHIHALRGGRKVWVCNKKLQVVAIRSQGCAPKFHLKADNIILFFYCKNQHSRLTYSWGHSPKVRKIMQTKKVENPFQRHLFMSKLALEPLLFMIWALFLEFGAPFLRSWAPLGVILGPQGTEAEFCLTFGALWAPKWRPRAPQ